MNFPITLEKNELWLNPGGKTNKPDDTKGK